MVNNDHPQSNDDGSYAMPFGRYKGQRLAWINDIDRQYLPWLSTRRWLYGNTRTIIERFLEREYHQLTAKHRRKSRIRSEARRRGVRLWWRWNPETEEVPDGESPRPAADS